MTGVVMTPRAQCSARSLTFFVIDTGKRCGAGVDRDEISRNTTGGWLCFTKHCWLSLWVLLPFIGHHWATSELELFNIIIMTCTSIIVATVVSDDALVCR